MNRSHARVPDCAPQGSGRRVYESVEEMLSQAVLSELVGQPVTDVVSLPFHSGDGKSGSHFLTVEVGGRQHFILKRISRQWDWVMRVTGDHRCRPVVAWQGGLFDRLPEVIVHGTVACAVDGEGWALLMRDFRDVMIPPGDAKLTDGENDIFLDSMAALHASFWDKPEAADIADGFCDLRYRYACFSPALMRPEAEGPDAVPQLVLEGWELFPSLVDPAIARLVGGLLQNVQPLADALSRYPHTVVHGDWKLGNLGIIRQAADTDGPSQLPRAVLLDWALTGPAPPASDLAWYLALNSARLPVSKERCIALYRDSLAHRLDKRFDAQWWPPQLELCLLGAFVQFGWEKALGAIHGETEAVRSRERAELAWWSEQARAGARWL